MCIGSGWRRGGTHVNLGLLARRLGALEAMLDRARDTPEAVYDEELLTCIRATYWGTNCWCFVELSLAIISAACAARPS